MVLAAVLVPVLAFAGLELGGLMAVAGSQSQAEKLRSAGQYEQAVAMYRVLESQGNPVLLLARGAIDSAPADAGRTILDWATALDGQGHPDQALLLLDNAQSLGGVSLPQPDESREHAGIALRSARAEAASGHWDVALQRLDQLAEDSPPSDLASQGIKLRPTYALNAAQQLLDQGHGIAAVTALDNLVREVGSGTAVSQAQGVLPRALLAAGQEALDSHDEAHALTYLQRIVSDFSASSQARQARILLRAPQSVTGTVVRGSTPVGHLELRLGSHFSQVGSGYRTSGPYYYATTDGRGDFTVDSIPVGGPYVVELLENSGWTTTVGPDGPAYQFTVQPLTPVDLAFVVLPG
jgi:hypothetical protein